MEVAGQVRSVQLDSSVSNKRPKLDSANDSLPDHCCLSCPHSPKNSVSPTTTFEFPHQIHPTSLCFNNTSSTSSDLKADEYFVSPSYGFSSYEKKEEITESETIKKKRKICQASSTDTAKMPSTEEIEEFFSVAEKLETKRFMEKYNYDIVKDVALEGRYQWVCIKP